ncbi:MAG: AraC family transcriptional regulator [Spirochaetota bacterium]
MQPRHIRVDTKGFFFTVSRHTLSRDFEMHTHNVTELVVVIGGVAEHHINDARHVVRRGDVYVVNPGTAHAFSRTEGTVIYNLSYPATLPADIAPELARIPGYQSLFVIGPRSHAASGFACRLMLSTHDLAVLERKIETLWAELRGKEPGYEALVKAYFTDILAFLSRRYVPASSAPAAGTYYKAAHAASFLESNFSDNITLAGAAKAVGLSVRHLTRLFGECFGVSPIDYLLRVRISRAADMLRSSDASVSDIAYDCGFSDSNYFTRMFRRETGTTPVRYRMNARLDTAAR